VKVLWASKLAFPSKSFSIIIIIIIIIRPIIIIIIISISSSRTTNSGGGIILTIRILLEISETERRGQVVNSPDS
jgi:ABC-type spermidine/putrescine transport system permease subunit II